MNTQGLHKGSSLLWGENLLCFLFEHTSRLAGYFANTILYVTVNLLLGWQLCYSYYFYSCWLYVYMNNRSITTLFSLWGLCWAFTDNTLFLLAKRDNVTNLTTSLHLCEPSFLVTALIARHPCLWKHNVLWFVIALTVAKLLPVKNSKASSLSLTFTGTNLSLLHTVALHLHMVMPYELYEFTFSAVQLKCFWFCVRGWWWTMIAAKHIKSNPSSYYNHNNSM